MNLKCSIFIRKVLKQILRKSILCFFLRFRRVPFVFLQIVIICVLGDLAKPYEVKLEFDDGALHAIAAKAMEKDTGARALRAILEEYMLDIMYEIPKDDSIGEVIITKEYIEGNGGPRILLRGQEVPLLENNN